MRVWGFGADSAVFSNEDRYSEELLVCLVLSLVL